MRQQKLIVLLSLCSFHAHAQIDRPISFKSETDARLIKEDDSGKYFVAMGDTTNIVFINDDLFEYKLLNKNNVILAKGNFSDHDDEIIRERKWTEYYENGKIKSTGNYYRNHPIGEWEHFYPSGKLKNKTTYSVFVNEDNEAIYGKSGPYFEYYENGNPKVTGLYALTWTRLKNVSDTISVIDPVTGNKTMRVTSRDRPTEVKFGTWEYYTTEGVLEKKEDNN